jgi:type I restriction enzyme M protein
MADYLNQIAEARADMVRFKGEKEAFEQSNAPDDADEEELATWNCAKDLDRQMRELKLDNRDMLRELAKCERAAAKVRATAEEKRAAAEAKAALQPVFDQLATLEAALAPYEQIKADFAAARARYRELTNAFVGEIKARCAMMTDDQKCALVLELFAQDVQAGLDAAMSEKWQELVRFVEGLWDKYYVTLTTLTADREALENDLGKLLGMLGYR